MTINYGRQHLDDKDFSHVLKALRSRFITQGDYVKKFEESLKKKFLSKYSLSTSSGTASLHLITKSLNLRNNDLVLVTALTFIATANSAIYEKCNVDLVDIELDTGCISIRSLQQKIEKYKKIKKKIKAVYVTDYAGHPSDWKSLKKLKKKYKFYLICDNCHSFGSKIDNEINYATKYADAVSLSFHPVKHITTGEGGAILTNNKKIHSLSKLMRSHSIERSKKFLPWYYKINYTGYNYRMSDINAALGFSQLKKLNKFISYRRKVAKKYNNFFKNFKVCNIPVQKKNYFHSYHLYPLHIDFNKLNANKAQLFDFLQKKKIKLQVHYVPLFHFKYLKDKFKLDRKEYKNTTNFYNGEISLPIYYGLSEKKIKLICSTFEKFFKKYIK